MTDFDIQSAFNATWHEEVKERFEASGIPPENWRAAGKRTKDKPNREDGEWWQTAGVEMVEKYITWRNESEDSAWKVWEPVTGEPAIELGITAPIGGVTVKGFIDRVFQTPPYETEAPERLVVVDLKTGSRNPESDLQLGFYACLIEVSFGIRPKFGGYYQARDGKVLKPLVDLSHYSVELLGSYLRDFVRARNQGIYLPVIGGHCKSCGVARYCAAVNGVDASKFDPAHPEYRRNTENT